MGHEKVPGKMFQPMDKRCPECSGLGPLCWGRIGDRAELHKEWWVERRSQPQGSPCKCWYIATARCCLCLEELVCPQLEHLGSLLCLGCGCWLLPAVACALASFCAHSWRPLEAWVKPWCIAAARCSLCLGEVVWARSTKKGGARSGFQDEATPASFLRAPKNYQVLPTSAKKGGARHWQLVLWIWRRGHSRPMPVCTRPFPPHSCEPHPIYPIYTPEI